MAERPGLDFFSGAIFSEYVAKKISTSGLVQIDNLLSSFPPAAGLTGSVWRKWAVVFVVAKFDLPGITASSGRWPRQG